MDRVRHPFSTALALCALVAQLALPFAHEWQVARQEADHPLGFGSSGPGMAEDADSGHSHHDAELCRLCPALSQLRVPCWAWPRKRASFPFPFTL